MNNKKIVITGINGFLGKNLLRLIVNLSPSAQIYGLSKIFDNEDNFVAVKCDLTNKKHTKLVISEIKPDYIFHLAGIGNNDDWEKLFDSNVVTTISLLESIRCLGSPVPRTIVIGSAAEYGSPESLPICEEMSSNPMSRYGASMSCRAVITKFYANIGLDVILARIFNITGPGVSELSPVGSFVKQIVQIEREKKYPTIDCGNLEPKRDFIDIDDAMKALYFLALKGKSKETYNICSGKSISIREMLDILLSNSKLKINVSIDRSKVRQIDIPDIYGSDRKIYRDIEWMPTTTIEESLKRTLDYYRNIYI